MSMRSEHSLVLAEKECRESRVERETEQGSSWEKQEQIDRLRRNPPFESCSIDLRFPERVALEV